MDDLERIMQLFAQDIKEYVSMGGSLEDIDSTKVYELIDKEKTSNTDE